MELSERSQTPRTVPESEATLASVDSSHPVRSTAGLQAKQKGEVMGSPLQHHHPLPTQDALAQSVLGFHWN